MNIEEINVEIDRLERLKYEIQKEQRDELIEKYKDYIGKYYKSSCNSIGRIEYLEMDCVSEKVFNTKDISLSNEGDMVYIEDELFKKDDITIISREEFVKLYKKLCNKLLHSFDKNIMEDNV